MKMIFLISVLCIAQVLASPITIYGTGQNAGGGLAAPGTADIHWSFGTVATANPNVAPPAGSQWVGPGADLSADWGVRTDYYQQNFDLSDRDPATAELHGEVAVDDDVEILLNGVSTGQFCFSCWGFRKSWSVTSGFVKGINTITFKATSIGGPAGITISIAGTATISICGNGIVESGEDCEGGQCCNNCLFSAPTTVCRASAGICDLVEYCTGNSVTCPVDSFKPATTLCRKSIGPCDPAEFCTGYSAPCPKDVSGEFETNCPGLFVDFNGQEYSWLNYEVISFNNFVANTGDIEGRLAVKNDALFGNGYSVGYEIHEFATDLTLPYSVVAGHSVNYGSGAIYPDGSNIPHVGAKEDMFVGDGFVGPAYLAQSVNGYCPTTGCLDSSFDGLQLCYDSYQTEMSSHADNVAAVIQWSGLYLTCNSNSPATYYVTLQANQMNTYTWVSLDNCNPDARWVVNIPGTDDVVFTGATLPGVAGQIIYNIPGASRNIRVETSVTGSILAPRGRFSDSQSLVVGKVIAGDILINHQTNRNACFVPKPKAVASK